MIDIKIGEHIVLFTNIVDTEKDKAWYYQVIDGVGRIKIDISKFIGLWGLYEDHFKNNPLYLKKMIPETVLVNKVGNIATYGKTVVFTGEPVENVDIEYIGADLDKKFAYFNVTAKIGGANNGC